MSTFARYVLKHKKEATPEGDVARDLAQDIKEGYGAKATMSYKALYKHVTETHRGSERMVATLERMGEAYKAYKAERKATADAIAQAGAVEVPTFPAEANIPDIPADGTTAQDVQGRTWRYDAEPDEWVKV